MQTRIRTLMNERGSILVIGLLTLVVLSLIGVAATTTSRVEVEIAGNDKAVKQAFYAAEFGLTHGETVVQALQHRLDLNEGATSGHYDIDDKIQPDWHDLKWDNTDSVQVPAIEIPDGLEEMASPSRYTIEERGRQRQGESLTTGHGVSSEVYRFTVSGLGTGGSATSKATVRSIYIKRFY